MMTKIPLLVIVGPTASGKTALSVQLAGRLNGEIISADSMQVYRGMSIATAVPTAEERQNIPHHLMECIDPTESFAVSDYVLAAHRKIAEVHSSGRLPILVGGTGLYVDSLVQNLQFSPQADDKTVREALYAEADELGLEEMHRRLSEIDPQAAQQIHLNDKKRILRALEIYYTTGQTKSVSDELAKSAESPYAPLFIGLCYNNREILYDRINRRVDIMLDCGLLQEAEQSFALSHSYATAAQAIGHKELFRYFAGECALDEAVAVLKQKTRQYAKRQMTWFTKNKDIRWIAMDAVADPLSAALEYVSQWQNTRKGEENH